MLTHYTLSLISLGNVTSQERYAGMTGTRLTHINAWKTANGKAFLIMNNKGDLPQSGGSRKSCEILPPPLKD
jgi:hypothetical protein